MFMLELKLFSLLAPLDMRMLDLYTRKTWCVTTLIQPEAPKHDQTA